MIEDAIEVVVGTVAWAAATSCLDSCQLTTECLSQS